MARVAEGWKLRARNGVWYVRFTVEGHRYDLSTGCRDKSLAGVEARRLYEDTLRKVRDRSRAPSQTSRLPLTEHVAEWLVSLENTHEERTQETLKRRSVLWVKRWNTLAEITTGAMADFMRERLGRVMAATVRHDLSALRQLLLWADEQGHLAHLPASPVVPKRATGKRVATRPEGTTPLSFEEIDALLSHLPEWSSVRHDRRRIRDYFIVFAETGLRPSTLGALSVPEHWSHTHQLRIDVDIDKADDARVVPISDRAFEALCRAAPEGTTGLIFGPLERRAGWLRDAARAAGIPEERANRIVPYDLRHSRITNLLGAGAPLTGVQRLVGHRRLSTTDKYNHPHMAHAEAALAFASTGPAREGSGAIVEQGAPVNAPVRVSRVRPSLAATAVFPRRPQGRRRHEAHHRPRRVTRSRGDGES